MVIFLIKVINIVVTIVPEGMSTLCTYLMLELMIIRTMQWLLTGSNYDSSTTSNVLICS